LKAKVFEGLEKFLKFKIFSKKRLNKRQFKILENKMVYICVL